MSLVGIFLSYLKKAMHTREAPDFWGLHENMNCAFPLTSMMFLYFCLLFLLYIIFV